jgi:hypothetical protein
MYGDAVGFCVHPPDNKEICGMARAEFPAPGLTPPTIVANSQQYPDFGREHVFDRFDRSQKD